MKETFDEEARRWLPHPGMIDTNIQPPGYASVEMTRYMMDELEYFKIIENDRIVGGIIVTLTGNVFGRIDRIFVQPDHQGKKIGSKAMKLIEETFPNVGTWELETSSRQVNNHHFYGKMGYKTTFQSEDEYCYIKKLDDNDGRLKDKDLSHTIYKNGNLEHSVGYQLNGKGIGVGSSTLEKARFNNCNISHATFQNINFRDSLFADLNLTQSAFKFVTMGGVNFRDTDLGEGSEPLSFERCDLEGTVMKNCNLRNMDIRDCDLTGMKIDGIPVEELLRSVRR
ncbi:GNAT family N-acetyltransferase [Bacillus sp. KH172YL63]|uniref:GNAT family N-acetyltransferase n=1 Tax=Bacillus sp. KH172YL63 TaxID=2709784 RepID=UPI001566EDE9|nr:GNAT family N-acetyltransferase [Bacillus sp. KH172YL63]